MKKVVWCGALKLSEERRAELLAEGFEYVSPIGKKGIPDTEADWVAMTSALQTADGLIPGGMYVDEDVLSLAPALRAVVFPGTSLRGFVDEEACKKRGVTVACCPGVNARSVAEYTSALITAALKEIPSFNARVKAGVWKPRSTADIFDKTVGILGMGNVGSKIASILHMGYGCPILYYGTKNRAESETALGARRVDLDTILRTSDVLVISLALNRDTEDLINGAALARMKHSAILVNVARAEIVNRDAVLVALASGTIAKYVTDVFHPDPVSAETAASWAARYPDDSRLIVTPHTAFSSPNTAREMERAATLAMSSLLNLA